MATELKVRHLSDDTYQVVELDECGYETVYFQGSIADCEAYVRLNDSGRIYGT